MLSQTKKGHRYVIEYLTIFVYRSVIKVTSHAHKVEWYKRCIKRK